MDASLWRSTPLKGRRRLGRALLDVVLSGRLADLPPDAVSTPHHCAELLEIARYHRLDAHLADMAIYQPAPPYLHAALGNVRTVQLQRRVAMGADLARLSALLDGAGVAWVVLKGPVTAQRHHSRPSQRSFSDLDVLVRPRDFERVVQLLESAGGAHLADRNWSLIRRLGCGELNVILPFGTFLDLHWDLLAESPDRRAFSVDSDGVVARRVGLTLDDGTTVPAPDPVDELLHLALHAVVGGTNSLGRLRDVALAVSGPIDWDGVAGRSRTWRTDLVTAVAVDRATSLFAPSLHLPPRGTFARSWGWGPLMDLAGKVIPEVGAPPATRWSSHVKLTRSSPGSSYSYAASELAGFATRSLRPRRSAPEWDAAALQRPDDDTAARHGYFRDIASTGAARGA